MKPKKSGSRYLYEPFSPSFDYKVSAIETLLESNIAYIKQRLDHIDSEITKLDKRLWMACFSIVMVLLAEIIASILIHMP